MVIYHLSDDNIQTKISLKTLEDEYETLKKNVTVEDIETKRSLKTLKDENEALKKNLTGGDLVKIDSEEEQKFLEEKVKNKMRIYEDMFWIGLTDSEEEDKWIWVDGSLLNKSLSFWFEGEPNNVITEDPEGEHCVRMGKKGGAKDLKCWFDKSCNIPQRSICEKPAQTGHLQDVCV
ncbi:C-type lectin domain family 4 member E-like [Scomber scombrus]|uniref:C-type lectin domain family 4 member E-like n=1 Tax=Scomber scombrus TaxID=13677 RepID=A0AAV1P2N4_SCOSC